MKSLTSFSSIFFLIITTLVVLTGCDTSSEIYHNEFIHTYPDDLNVTVRLTDAHIETLRFDDINSYHEHLNRLDEQGVVTVNKTLWKRLKHANDPSEVSVLDINGEVIVGTNLYRVDYEKIVRIDKDGNEFVEIFYGREGDQDLKDFNKAALALFGGYINHTVVRNDYILDSMKFDSTTINDTTLSKQVSGCTTWSGSNSTDHAQCDYHAAIDVPVNINWVTSDPGFDGSPGYFDIRVNMLNQSYRSGFKKKAYGVTQISVRDYVDPSYVDENGVYVYVPYTNNDPYYGTQICPSWSTVSGLSINGSPLPTKTVYLASVDLRLEGDYTPYQACFVSDRAGRRGGAQSSHSATIPGLFGSPSVLLPTYYLD